MWTLSEFIREMKFNGRNFQKNLESFTETYLIKERNKTGAFHIVYTKFRNQKSRKFRNSILVLKLKIII
jgi:hypothetical protein